MIRGWVPLVLTPLPGPIWVDKDGHKWPQEPGRYQPGRITKGDGRESSPGMTVMRSAAPPTTQSRCSGAQRCLTRAVYEGGKSPRAPRTSCLRTADPLYAT